MTAMKNDPRPITLGTSGTSLNIQYHEFECVQCGATDRNTYCEPHRTDMLNRRLCWTCNFWRDFEDENTPKKHELTIIEGHVYGPGNRTSGLFRGMAGRRFDIEYINQSVYVGQRCTTFDLWSGSSIPESLREKFPDTARFLNGARKFAPDAVRDGCWSESNVKSEPYPLPAKLVRNTER